MIYTETDRAGVRTYRMPRALADVAMEIFPGMDQTGAIFRLARALSMHDAHTVERIALNCSHADAVAFARQKIEKSALVARRPH
mgnify:CR=1 FL=1